MHRPVRGLVKGRRDHGCGRHHRRHRQIEPAHQDDQTLPEHHDAERGGVGKNILEIVGRAEARREKRRSDGEDDAKDEQAVALDKGSGSVFAKSRRG